MAPPPALEPAKHLQGGLSVRLRSAHARSSAGVVFALILGTWNSIGAQSSANLPPPDRSRPPLLTGMSSEQIMYSVHQLSLFQLLSNLQLPNPVALDADLSGIAWDLGDLAASRYPACNSLGAAASALSQHLVSAGATNGNIPLSIKHLQLVDSAGLDLARFTLVVNTGRISSHAYVEIPVLIVFDEGGLRETHGLLSGLCGIVREG